MIRNNDVSESQAMTFRDTELQDTGRTDLTTVFTVLAETRVYPVLTKSTASWQSTLPVLTVPDLEDSVERMYARRISGQVEQQFMPTQRSYPADPISVARAADFLADYQKQLQSKVDNAKDEVKKITAEAEKSRKQQEREKAEYEAYKAEKISNQTHNK